MKIVLAYSGGLDTSVIVKWLKETYDAEIVTFAADIGQEEELKGLAQKAKKTGASKHYTLDLTEEFAKDYIYPMIRANAIYEGQYYLGTSIARPLIAKAQVDIAKKENADTVAHGATGKGNDQCRFELTYMALAPNLAIIAPWKLDAFRETFPGRAEMIEYCRAHKIPVEAALSDETGFPHKGTIQYVAPQIDPQTGTLYVRGILSNPDRALLPGVFVNIRLPMGRVTKSALLVPEIALQEDQGGRFLFLVGDDDVVQKRYVQLGDIVGNLQVATSGVNRDDRIVVGEIWRVTPGMKVTPKPATPGAVQ